MKSEMRNLLDRLQSHPNLEQFQTLHVFPNGRVSAVYRNGSMRFDDLDALEKFAYPQDDAATEAKP
jgi:putative hemolysin